MHANTNSGMSGSQRLIRQTCWMRTTIDLDVAVREIECRAGGWRTEGFEVGPVTWRDQGEGWPPNLKAERDTVAVPDSIGVEVRLGAQEGSIVLFKGGWCDLEYWSGSRSDEPVIEALGYPEGLTVEGFGFLLDSLLTVSARRGLADVVM